MPKEATSIFIAGIVCENLIFPLCPEVVKASFLRAFGEEVERRRVCQKEVHLEASLTLQQLEIMAMVQW